MKIPKPGKYKVNILGEVETVEFTHNLNFKAGISRVTFVELKKEKGAPYTI